MENNISAIAQGVLSKAKLLQNKLTGKSQIDDNQSITPQLQNNEKIGENITIDELNAINSQNNVQNLNSTQNVEDISNALSTKQKEDIIAGFEQEYEKLVEEFETAKNSNGFITGLWDKFKNFTKIGAGSNKTLNEINKLKEEIENLKKEPQNFAQGYKNITGNDLTFENLEKTLNFDDCSKATKSLDKYKEGQKMAVDTVADIVSGVASVGTVAFATFVGVAGTPFTAGTSLSLIGAGLAIAGGTGAAVKTSIKALDCVGNEKKYSLKNGIYDTTTGAINGMTSIFSAALGSTVGKAIMKIAGKEALETTVLKTGEAIVKQSGKQLIAKGSALLAEMSIDGGLSGMMDSLSRDVAEKITGESDKDIKEIAKDTLKGTAGGILGGVVIGGAFKGASKLGELAGKSKLGQNIANILGKNSANSIDELAQGVNKNILNEIDNAFDSAADLDFDSMLNKFSAPTSENIVTKTILDNAQDYTQEQLNAIVKLNNSGMDYTDIFNFIHQNIDNEQIDNFIKLYQSGVECKQILDICKQTSKQETDIIQEFTQKFNNNAKFDIKIKTLEDDSVSKNFNDMLQNLDLDSLDSISNNNPKVKSGGKIITTTAEFSPSDDCTVQVIQTINPDGTIKIERNEKIIDGISSTKKNPLYNSWNTDGSQSFQTTPWRFNDSTNVYIDEQFEIINDKISGEPIQILHTKRPDGQHEVLDRTLYNLKDYPEDIDIIEQIKKGDLKGGQELSKFVKNPDGSTKYFENIEANGCQIKRNCTTKSNGVDIEYSFKINDENGKELLNLERTFEKVSQNETKTTINGKQMTALFDDSTKTITLKNTDGKEIKIDIGSKVDETKKLYGETVFGERKEIQLNTLDNGSEILWEKCKELPADRLYELDKVDTWKLVHNMEGFSTQNTKSLATGDDSFIISHELGHQKDYSKGISSDKTINQLYEEELKAFNSKYTQSAGGEYFEYFSQKSSSASGGLAEIIAETNGLLSQTGEKYFSCSTRAQLLAQSFPKTISAIAEKLLAEY